MVFQISGELSSLEIEFPTYTVQMNLEKIHFFLCWQLKRALCISGMHSTPELLTPNPCLSFNPLPRSYPKGNR